MWRKMSRTCTKTACRMLCSCLLIQQKYPSASALTLVWARRVTSASSPKTKSTKLFRNLYFTNTSLVVLRNTETDKALSVHTVWD